MSCGFKEYRIESLHTLRVGAENFVNDDRILFEDVSEGKEVTFETQPFGSQLADVSNDTTKIDAADRNRYYVHSPQAFVIQNAVVRSQYGLVTVDDWLIRESVHHFSATMLKGFKYKGERFYETSLSMPKITPSLSIRAAYYAQAGINENYYHWIVIFLPKLSSLFLNSKLVGALPGIPIVLYPNFLDNVQKETAEVMADHYKLPFISLKDDISVGVEQLIFPIHLRSGGLRPHPSIVSTFEILKSRFYDDQGDWPDKVYISRKDTTNRELTNEGELEEFLANRGFSIVSLTGKSFREQLNIFAHARKLIGPHGAGLTNIAFCSRGTSFLELHMPSHLNWCYRRLAAVCSLRYGFLVGELTDGMEKYVNARKYRMDMSALRELVDSGEF